MRLRARTRLDHRSSRRDDRSSLLDVVAISSSIEGVRFLLLCSSRSLFLLPPHFFRLWPEDILPLDYSRRAIIVSDVDRLLLWHIRNEEDIIRSSVRDLDANSISLFERFEFRVELCGFATLFLQFPIGIVSSTQNRQLEFTLWLDLRHRLFLLFSSRCRGRS